MECACVRARGRMPRPLQPRPLREARCSCAALASSLAAVQRAQAEPGQPTAVLPAHQKSPRAACAPSYIAMCVAAAAVLQVAAMLAAPTPQEWAGTITFFDPLLNTVNVPLWAHIRIWGPGRNGFPPPEKNELVLPFGMGCADTVQFQPTPNTPF